MIPTIAGINIWGNMGYTALLLFGGLVMIPRSYYEAASLDGASEWHMFRTITLPLLRPVLALVLVVTIVGSFQVFDTVADRHRRLRRHARRPGQRQPRPVPVHLPAGVRVQRARLRRGAVRGADRPAGRRRRHPDAPAACRRVRPRVRGGARCPRPSHRPQTATAGPAGQEPGTPDQGQEGRALGPDRGLGARSALLLLLTLFPFYWMLRTALATNSMLVTGAQGLLPAGPDDAEPQAGAGARLGGGDRGGRHGHHRRRSTSSPRCATP